MTQDKKDKGIGLTLGGIGLAITIFITIAGYFATSISRTNADVEQHKETDVEVYKDVATLKEAISNIKENQTNMNSKIDVLLRDRGYNPTIIENKNAKSSN